MLVETKALLTPASGYVKSELFFSRIHLYEEK